MEIAVTEATTIATAGEILVEFVSHKKNCGLSEISPYSGPYPSGAPAIFLDQAARMGARTELFGGVGNDGFGRSVLARLKRDGVGTKGVTVSDQGSTGVAFVTYYDNGQRDFIFHLANTPADSFAVEPHHLDLAHTWLHVSAASLGNARLRDAIMGLAARVEQAGGKITCDPNARPELMRDASASRALADVVARSHILMPSTSDLEFMFPGIPEEESLERLSHTKVETLVLKRGAAGATIIQGTERRDLEPHPVDELDPTGAGDCFCGTFVALVAAGMDAFEAGRLANAAGAIAVTRRGPMEGNSDPDEIAAFLEQHRSQRTP
ncbi:MAG: sugar kinase [Pseudomonadota bacterium]